MSKKSYDLFLSILRDKSTPMNQFRKAARTLTQLLAQEALEQVKSKEIEIATPMGNATGSILAQKTVLVPILRSGITMVEPFLDYFTTASIGVVGLRRDEQTAIAHLYYENIPPIGPHDQVIMLDPMIATGGTAHATLEILTKKGVRQKQILFVAIVCAPEGIAVLRNSFPEVKIIVAAHDKKLNDKKFIVPGLGDFGDRYFGTDVDLYKKSHLL